MVIFVHSLRALVVIERAYCEAYFVDCYRKFGIVMLRLFDL